MSSIKYYVNDFICSIVCDCAISHVRLIRIEKKRDSDLL